MLTIQIDCGAYSIIAYVNIQVLITYLCARLMFVCEQDNEVGVLIKSVEIN